MPSLPSRPNWHGFYQVEDPHGRWWRNLRAHYWAGFGDTNPDGEPRWSVHVGGEWTHLHRTLRRLRLKVSTTGEETLDVAYGLGPLAQHYWSLVVDGPGEPVTKGGRTHWRRRQLRLPPVRFDVEAGVTGASWCFGADDGSWSTEAPTRERLRRGHATWWRYARYRRGDPEVMAEADTEVLLPEGAYPLHVKLEREVRQARLGPLWLLRAPPGRRRDRWRRGPSVWLPWGRRVGWTAAWEAPDGLPVPGKGESSYDCDPDAVFASGVDVRPPYDSHDQEWLAAAVASATSVVLRTRMRYGSGLADTGKAST